MAIAAATPMIVASNRYQAFSNACPRVGAARIATVSAAVDGASSSSQKLAPNATTTAIHTRIPNAPELTEAPARLNGRAVVAVVIGVTQERQLTDLQEQAVRESGLDYTVVRLAFNGSINETEYAWTRNWESFNVFTSWGDIPRVDGEEASFAKLWADKALRAITIDVPTALRDRLLTFLPDPDRLPKRLIDRAEPTAGGAKGLLRAEVPSIDEAAPTPRGRH
jgi:hypothetical protein